MKIRNVCLLNTWLLAAAFDASMPAADVEFVQRGSWPGYSRGPAIGVAVRDGFAFCSTEGAGLMILDVRDPLQPRWAASAAEGEFVAQTALDGDHALVLSHRSHGGYQASLSIVDIRDPARARTLGRLILARNCCAGSLAVDKRFAYVTYLTETNQMSSWQLGVIDISDPATPKLISGLDIPFFARSMALVGQQLCLVGGAWKWPVIDDKAYFEVIDVTDPAQPRRISGIDIPGDGEAMAMAGGYALVAGSQSGLHVVDVREPALPKRIVHKPDWQGRWITVIETRAVLSPSGTILDVVSPQAPTKIGSAGSAHGPIAVDGTHAYAAVLEAGVEIRELTDLTTPRAIARFRTSGSAQDVVIANDSAFVLESDGDVVPHKLRVLDLRDRVHPTLVASYESSIGLRQIAVSGRHVLVSTWPDWREPGSEELLLLDVGTPPNIGIAGRYAARGLNSFALLGRHAILAGSGIEIIDIENASQPRHVSSVELPNDRPWGGFSGVTVHGNIAFTQSGFELISFDLTNLESPTYLATAQLRIRPDGNSLATFFSGDIAGALRPTGGSFGGFPFYGFQLVDMRDPRSPATLGLLHFGGASSFAIRDRRAYVGGSDVLRGGGALWAVDISDSRAPLQVGSVDLADRASSVNRLAESSGLLYAAAGGAGLLIFEPRDRDSLRLDPPSFTQDGHLQFRLIGLPGRTVRIQRGGSIRAWLDWKTVTLGTDPLPITDPDIRKESIRLYRAVSP
jgi:hypothetical protein